MGGEPTRPRAAAVLRQDKRIKEGLAKLERGELTPETYLFLVSRLTEDQTRRELLMLGPLEEDEDEDVDDVSSNFFIFFPFR